MKRRRGERKIARTPIEEVDEKKEEAAKKNKTKHVKDVCLEVRAQNG